MIEVDGIKLYTEKEWERRHRHVLKRQLGKGVERTWRATPGNVSAVWYREDQTRPWTDAEVRRARREAKAKREERRLAALRAEHEEKIHRIEAVFENDLERTRHEARIEAEVSALRSCWGIEVPYGDACRYLDGCSAWEWVLCGLVPLDCARWYEADTPLANRYRCGWWDVRPDSERAADLIETGPESQGLQPDGTPYDGRPWW